MDLASTPALQDMTDASGATGADLRGWSALPLMAPPRSSAGSDQPWLFVLDAVAAWVSSGPLASAKFKPAPGRYDGAWPFGDSSLAGVVIDGHALARRMDLAGLKEVIAEARRTSGRHGDVLVVCGTRFFPRRLGAWREYGRSAAAWRRAASSSGVQTRTAGYACLDRGRIVDLTPCSDNDANACPAVRSADHLLLRLTRVPRPEPDTVHGMVAQASRQLDMALRIEHIGVRKIGKTAVFLSSTGGRRFIMRIARSPIALIRARRNFGMLQWLQGSDLAEPLKVRAPAAVAEGEYAGYHFFVETCLPGTPGPPPTIKPTEWEFQAVEYITTLHVATRQLVRFDDGAVSRLLHEPIARLRNACAPPEAVAVLGRIEHRCRRALAGQVLPLVAGHGDFTASNCLFDAAGRLTGVIDWELADSRGLPLIDLLQLMPVPGEASHDSRWRRFDAWLELWREPERALADPVFGPYIRAFELPVELVRALILLQWILHVADRIEARREDARWLRLRVQQPLSSLGRMVRD